MTSNQTRKALRLVPHTPDCDQATVENLKRALAHAFISKGEEHMLESTSWYAKWKEAYAMNDDNHAIQYGPLNWEIETTETHSFQATCHLDSQSRLQVEGRSSAELHERIVLMTVKWLGIGPKS